MFYLIDKPTWISSFDVIRKLRVILETKKLWHTGTLDPLASWCLLVATDQSTKLIPLLEKLEKSYIFEMRIDGTTESLDLWTSITPHSGVTSYAKTQEELLYFIENMASQIPPAYSALRIDGERSYMKARRWEILTLKERPISISEVEILEFQPPFFRIKLRISSGWYIRSIARDIWIFFSTPGGYITKLERISLHGKGTHLKIENSQKLETFNRECFLSFDELFSDFPLYEIKEEFFEKINNGIIPYDFQLDEMPKVWQKFFVKYRDSSLSLLMLSPLGFSLIKNNIVYSHKIRRK